MAGDDRFSLGPMAEAASAAAIERLRLRASAAEEAAARLRSRGMPAPRPGRDEAAVREQLALAKIMLAGGRFSEAEYCFYALFHVERVHENRWLGGAYDRELQPFMRAMERIERNHGLEEDEFFPPDGAPEEWLELNRRYEAVLSDKLEGVLAEFGLAELLDLRRRDRERYDRLWETGRLAFFTESGAEANLLNLIRLGELEARRAAAAEAYWSAVCLLGQAAEAQLLLYCLRRPDAAREAAARVPGELRPPEDDPLRWTRAQLTAAAVAGGWLHNLPDERLVSALVEWLAGLPPARPGRLVLGGAQPWLGRTEYQASLDAYSALRSSLDLATRAAAAGATLQ